ncbi:MAG TPA: type I phosphomannose isomerase catalytic subunit [Steroidobacteraceae bacterium]|jgi:mannose-6-phosphate isomerase
MKETPLYPLKFEPIYQYRLWGGRRLANLLSTLLPGEDPVGEAWLLSDRDDHPSRVADGPLKGNTLGELLAQSPQQLMGKLSGAFRRFPLLLKFLDVRTRLSVQVHPSDAHEKLIPASDTGKTEAWVVLEVGPGARVFAGLKTAAAADTLRQAITNGTVADQLASFVPKPRDAVFIGAGAIHSLSDAVVFEVQQNSDVTFRLYDWDQLDPRTGRPRSLQVDQAMACIDFAQGAIGPITPLVKQTQPLRETLVQGSEFGMTRISGRRSFKVGAARLPRVLVCLAGDGFLEHAGADYPIRKGDALLLPAVVGELSCRPHGLINVLEISLPEAPEAACS